MVLRCMTVRQCDWDQTWLWRTKFASSYLCTEPLCCVQLWWRLLLWPSYQGRRHHAVTC